MTILAVDTQAQRLAELADCLREVFPQEEIVEFADPALAVQHSSRTEVGMVFVSADTWRLNGLQVAMGVQFYRPQAETFLVTYEKTPKRYFRQKEISGCLPYPVTADAIRTAVHKTKKLK